MDKRTWTLGIPDREFFQRKPERGLLTKAEVRVIALAKLRIKADSVVWDIGGGAGSVSIEAALLASQGEVWVIEKNQEDCENIRQNIEKFQTSNVRLVQGTAPRDLADWPAPDAVFVGGTSGFMADVIALGCQRLRASGRIVVDVATLENLQEARQGLEANSFASDVVLVSIARSKDIVGLTRLEALHPVFVITGWRAEEEEL